MKRFKDMTAEEEKTVINNILLYLTGGVLATMAIVTVIYIVAAAINGAM